jgi:outer membrane protein assembly factor BamB
VVGTPAIGDKDGERVVFATSGDTKLYTLNLADGTAADSPISVDAEFSAFLSGTSERPIPIYAAPVLYNGMVLIGLHQGNYPLYAFDQETLLERWHYEPPKS